MAETEKKANEVTYNYTLEQARALYALVEKPANMTDHEWAIVSDEGFRKYIASTLGIAYASRQELKKKLGTK